MDTGPYRTDEGRDFALHKLQIAAEREEKPLWLHHAKTAEEVHQARAPSPNILTMGSTDPSAYLSRQAVHAHCRQMTQMGGISAEQVG